MLTSQLFIRGGALRPAKDPVRPFAYKQLQLVYQQKGRVKHYYLSRPSSHKTDTRRSEARECPVCEFSTGYRLKQAENKISEIEGITISHPPPVHCSKETGLSQSSSSDTE